jgi:hypothetical protein
MLAGILGEGNSEFRMQECWNAGMLETGSGMPALICSLSVVE